MMKEQPIIGDQIQHAICVNKSHPSCLLNL
jgi:hypothetical protein